MSGSDAGGAARLQRSSHRALRLMGFVHGTGNIPKPHEMGTFPHTGTPEAAVWAPSGAPASPLLSEGSVRE